MLEARTPILYKNFPGVIDSVGDKFGITFCPTLQRKSGKGFVFQTQSVRDKDITVICDSVVSSLNDICLRASDEVRQDNVRTELADLWQLICSDGEMSANDLPFQTIWELSSFAGEADNVYLFYKVLSEDIHFTKCSETVFRCNSSQEIDAIRRVNEEKQQAVIQRQEFILRLKNKKLDLPDDRKFMYEVEALAMGKTDKSKILKEAGFKETPETAHRLLLDTGVWEITKNPYPARFGLSMTSNTESMPPPVDDGRVTVETVAYAIDSQWSEDPDDAIAFDGEYLWVHVADPASTVTIDSPADKVAMNRGATLYLPEGPVRMLDQDSLADYALGLGENRYSRALSFKIKLNDKNDVDSVEILKTLVEVKRLTYEQADEAKDSSELAPLYEIAGKNIAKRKLADAVFITMPEVHISVKDDVVSIDGDIKASEATNVVRECMLLAGEAAAKFAFLNGIPFPYISQGIPQLPNEIPDGLAGSYKLRRNMKSRVVGVTPTQHAGLGLPMYSQVTSPLRRYVDFIAHQQLHAFLDGRQPVDKDTLLQKISVADVGALACAKAERASNMHWICVYLMQHPDWTGEATVVDTKNSMSVCIVNDLAIETLLNLGTGVKLNDTVRVKAEKINLTELNISFKVMGGLS